MPNRNVESYFSQIPKLHNGRSIIPRPSTHKTTFNVSELIPVYVDMLYPGDSVKMKTSKIVRLQTMLTPVMDNLYLDMYWFFVPMRLIWSHTHEFFGENTQSAWVPQATYRIPSISAPSGGFASGTLADYMGLPVGINWSNTDPGRPMALPFRAYALVCNEYFRDQDLTDPLNIPTGDSNQTGTNGGSYINDVANGGKPFKVSKYHDYFTSASKDPQKLTNPVTLPLFLDKAPVGAGTLDSDAETVFGKHSIAFADVAGGNLNNRWQQMYVQRDSSDTTKGFSVVSGTPATTNPGNTLNIYPTNLWADLSSTVGAITINSLRLAVQLQAYYERLATTGSRMTEWLRGIWGITSPDARLQRPEYLGGNRIALNVHEVINQAQTTNDFLGDLGAMSRTVDSHYDFEYANSDAPGILLGLVCARYDHTYGQGFEKWWNRLDFEEWYNPYFASIGAQPIYDYEIYADATTIGSKSVFAYSEAWADMRFKPDRVSGEMRPGVANNLASWHFADYYSQKPVLSDAWIREDPTNVDRTLAVQSSVSNQIFADFYFDAVYTRIMPVFSVPGFGKTF